MRKKENQDGHDTGWARNKIRKNETRRVFLSLDLVRKEGIGKQIAPHTYTYLNSRTIISHVYMSIWTEENLYCPVVRVRRKKIGGPTKGGEKFCLFIIRYRIEKYKHILCGNKGFLFRLGFLYEHGLYI
jgi:hypothetical protein